MDETWTTAAKNNFVAAASLFGLAQDGNYIYVSGWTGTGGGELTRLDKTTGAKDATWNTPISFERYGYTPEWGYPSGVAFDDTAVYVVGSFNRVDGNYVNIIKVSKTDRSVLDWADLTTEGSLDDQSRAPYVYKGVVLFGDQVLYNSSPTDNLRRINLSTNTIDESWQPDVEWYENYRRNVYRIIAEDDYIYVAGDFLDIDTTGAKQLARFSASTGVIDGSFVFDLAQLLFSESNPASMEIQDILIRDNYIYVSGLFIPSDYSEYIGFVVRINLETKQLDTDWGPVLTDNDIITLASDSSYIYFGGWFSTPTVGLGRASLSTGDVDMSWDLGLDDGVDNIIVDDGYIYLGAEWAFSEVLGESRQGFASR